jgi:hypothetical protein
MVAVIHSCIFIASSTSAAPPVDYLREVKPILSARCYACHGALQQKRGLRLDAAALIRKGGKSGPAIVPGKSQESLLIDAITGKNRLRMPPEKEGAALTPKQVETLRTWIDQGAQAPDEPIPPDPRLHWAYQTALRPVVPAAGPAGWSRNAIDAFITAEHVKRGLEPRPEAPKQVLLRRVYLDLMGLPPTRAELQAFLDDSSPDAYEKVVDRLLADPRYGERWGRHWMDVWRYSDWYGSRHINELRNSRRHIWRWRDWIIESINQDKGLDQMILEMLAGDELAPSDMAVQRATGFLGRNFYVFNRTVWLQDTVEYTAAGFLGITLKCCRCHDHKYDPLSQEDYYRFRAFFEPYGVRTDALPGHRERLKANIAMGSPPGAELKVGFDRVYDAELTTPTYLFERGDEKHPVKDKPLTPGIPRVLENAPLMIQAVSLPRDSFHPELRLFRQQEMLAEAHKAAIDAEAAAQKMPGALAEKTLAAARAKESALVAALGAEQARHANPPDAQAQELARLASKAQAEATVRQAEEAELRAANELESVRKALKPGDAKTQAAVSEAEKKLAALREETKRAQAALANPKPLDNPLGPVYPASSTGRRLALARWIASRDNPLTARVAVNHIWMRHMGAPLVATVANFGVNGKRPTHPDLLDWLAIEFMEGASGRVHPRRGWNMKHLHRLIVTSSAYRMESFPSGADDPNLRADPENVYLWRMNPRRMEAELVRDSLLHLSGRLDRTMSGPELDPDTADTNRRRSIYFRHTPDSLPTLISLFDSADTAECYRRTESIMPQQALALSNSDLSFAEARVLAAKLSGQLGPDASRDAAFIRAAFEQVLARPPTEPERARCQEFLHKQTELLVKPGELTAFAVATVLDPKPSADPHKRARENLVHVLLNHNDFVTIR